MFEGVRTVVGLLILVKGMYGECLGTPLNAGYRVAASDNNGLSTSTIYNIIYLILYIIIMFSFRLKPFCCYIL